MNSHQLSRFGETKSVQDLRDAPEALETVLYPLISNFVHLCLRAVAQSNRLTISDTFLAVYMWQPLCTPA